MRDYFINMKTKNFNKYLIDDFGNEKIINGDDYDPKI